jgi:ABC-type Zn2+ transport system substrate-binding protein/surface adhesin
MKNTKRFSILAAFALSLVIAAGAFVAPTLSFANEEKHDEHDGHDHDKEGHEDHADDHSHDKH